MTSPYDLFATDTALEVSKGIDLDYGDFAITIRRAGGQNRKFSSLFTQKMKPYNKQLQNGTLSEDVQKKILIDLCAEAIVIGWRGVKDADGQEMPFTRENCVKLFTDLPDLFLEVFEQAQKFSNFRQEAKEVAEKN